MARLLATGPFRVEDGGGRVLLADVEVALEPGRLVVVSGPSGGGKTTLLRAVCGFTVHDGAERTLAGETYGDDRLPAWRARVTLLAQDAPSLPGTVEDNLAFPFAARAAAGRGFDREAAVRVLAEVGLGGVPTDRQVRSLSGGERHRLALARGLLWDPPVLVADEPLAALDGATAERCFERLAAFARRDGHAALCVLHDDALAGRADDWWRLADGRLGAAR